MNICYCGNCRLQRDRNLHFHLHLFLIIIPIQTAAVGKLFRKITNCGRHNNFLQWLHKYIDFRMTSTTWIPKSNSKTVSTPAYIWWMLLKQLYNYNMPIEITWGLSDVFQKPKKININLTCSAVKHFSPTFESCILFYLYISRCEWIINLFLKR